MAVGKIYQLKTYDRNGILANTVQDAKIGSFDWPINGGLGNLVIQFARKIDDFGEEFDIGINFKVELRVVDVETPPEGILIYTGYIQSYKQIARGSDEYVEANCVGYQTLLSKIILKSGSTTTITYTSVDPSYIVRDALSKAASVVDTNSQLVDNTGLSLTYTFRNNTIKEVLDKAVELSPDGFYWYSDANNLLRFSRVNYDQPDHILTFKSDFVELEVEKSSEDLVNVIYFTGGGDPALYRRSTRTSSLNEYGQLEGRLTDGRVTVNGTADRMATNTLDRYDHIITKVRITLADSNLENTTGVDLESLRPGQVVSLRNIVDDQGTLWDVAQWDVDFWDFNILGALANPFIITKIIYQDNSAKLELGTYQETFARQFANLEDKVNTTGNENVPTTPTDA